MPKTKLPETPADMRLVQREIAQAIGVSTGQAETEWKKLSKEHQAEVFQLCKNVTMPGRTRIKRIVIETGNALAMREGKKRRAEAITKQLGEIAEGMESKLITVDDIKKAISDCLENRRTPEQCQADWQAKINEADQAEKDRQAEEERKRLAAEKAEQERKAAEEKARQEQLAKGQGSDQPGNDDPPQDPTPAAGQQNEPPADPPAQLMTAGQLAKALGLDGGAAAVANLVAHGGMPETRDGNKRRYDLAACQAWIEAQDDAQEKSDDADKGGQPGDQL